MKFLRWVMTAALLMVVAALVWWLLAPPAPPEVDFATAERGVLLNELSTNGRTEPAEWMPVRAAREGRLVDLPVRRGAEVSEGQLLARLAAPEAEAELASARARVARAEAALAPAEQGGRQLELAELETALARAFQDREAAAREEAALDRLVQKGAATRHEWQTVRDRRELLDAEISGLRKKRAALVEPGDRVSARAALEEAKRNLAAVEARLSESTLRSPMSGVVYDLPSRAGDWVTPGTLVAKVGRLGRLRVLGFVDEPELGGLTVGQSVAVTWDALPGREWKGKVSALPTEVVALGSRQVGEVVTVVENPGQEIPAGANVNLRIQLRRVESAVSVPKEALRREGEAYGVYVLKEGKLSWRPVRTGVASVTRIEILEGVQPGDLVAVTGDIALRDGLAVRRRQ